MTRPLLGNFVLEALLGMERPSIFEYLEKCDSRNLQATCLNVCQWSDVLCSGIKIPFVEMDLEQAAPFRLWGHNHGYPS